MQLPRPIIDQLTVKPGTSPNLAERSTVLHMPKDVADEELQTFTAELTESQELLWASDTNALLAILQGLDAAGKDGTIKHVMSGVNPQGCQVTSFKQPSTAELGHDFLWRAVRALPPRGQIGIFNRSYYEDVLVVRVHPELLVADDGRKGKRAMSQRWKRRYEDINAFERHLDREGTRIVKVFLHLSKNEQKKRLLERLDDPSKYWKFSSSDLAERDYWGDYHAAYEEALAATSTAWAPWYVVPADHKHVTRALVAGILVHTIDELQLSSPAVTPAKLAEIEAARAKLSARDQ